MIKKYFIKDKNKHGDFSLSIESGRLTQDFIVHKHDFTELVIITGGSGKHIIDGYEYPISAGDVYVISGEVSHGFKDVTDLTLFNIIFDAGQIFNHNNDLKKLAGFQALFTLEPFYRKDHKFKSRLRLERNKMNYAMQLLDIMADEYARRDDGYYSIIQSYLTILVAFLSREYSEAGGGSASLKLLRLAKAVAYMEKNYTKPVRLEDLSSMSCLSSRHFNRIFLQNYKTSPIEYLIRLRLDHACKSLRIKEMSITQIAQESGFPDSNYFSRLFKHKYGVTPNGYRKRI